MWLPQKTLGRGTSQSAVHLRTVSPSPGAQGINISHLGKFGKSSTQNAIFWGDMLVSWRVSSHSFSLVIFSCYHLWCCFFQIPIREPYVTNHADAFDAVLVILHQINLFGSPKRGLVFLVEFPDGWVLDGEHDLSLDTSDEFWVSETKARIALLSHQKWTCYYHLCQLQHSTLFDFGTPSPTHSRIQRERKSNTWHILSTDATRAKCRCLHLQHLPALGSFLSPLADRDTHLRGFSLSKGSFFSSSLQSGWVGVAHPSISQPLKYSWVPLPTLSFIRNRSKIKVFCKLHHWFSDPLASNPGSYNKLLVLFRDTAGLGDHCHFLIHRGHGWTLRTCGRPCLHWNTRRKLCRCGIQYVNHGNLNQDRDPKLNHDCKIPQNTSTITPGAWITMPAATTTTRRRKNHCVPIQ